MYFTLHAGLSFLWAMLFGINYNVLYLLIHLCMFLYMCILKHIFHIPVCQGTHCCTHCVPEQVLHSHFLCLLSSNLTGDMFKCLGCWSSILKIDNDNK